MNISQANNHLNHLANLAREGCAYRGRIQQAEFPLPYTEAINPKGLRLKGVTAILKAKHRT